jgi:hypothetical protein
VPLGQTRQDPLAASAASQLRTAVVPGDSVGMPCLFPLSFAGLLSCLCLHERITWEFAKLEMLVSLHLTHLASPATAFPTTLREPEEGAQLALRRNPASHASDGVIACSQALASPSGIAAHGSLADGLI